MYNEHFGFREAPFSAIPSSKFFYANAQYREALANLRYGIKWRKGLVVVVGEVGTGKTTLLRKIVCNLETDIKPIFVSYDHLTYEQVLRLISKQLGLAADPQDRFALIEHIHEALLDQQKSGRAVALLIDEAQSLSDETFDDIRFLSNLETERGKLLQIVLSGQPELDARLSQPRLRNIKQRIVLNCRLTPLDQKEVELYIESRLQQAGYEGRRLFSGDAVRQIAVCCRGIPRLINILCDNALLLAYAQSRKHVEATMVEEAARDLDLWPERPGVSSPDEITGFVPSDESPAPRVTPAPATRSGARERIDWPRKAVAAGLTALIVGAGGAVYSRRDTGHVEESYETGSVPFLPPALRREVSTIVPPPEIPIGDGWDGRVQIPNRPDTARTSSSEGNRPAKQQRSTAKEKPVRPGNFAVAGERVFVRNAPAANANIIATLQAGTDVKVIRTRGRYLRVRTSVDGRVIYGYVHREDALLEPVGRQAAANSDGNAERPN